MAIPNLTGVPTTKVSGDTLGSQEVNNLGGAINKLQVRLAEMFGAGAFRSTDFAAIAVPGVLALEIGEGDAFVGASDQIGQVYQEGAVVVLPAQGIVTGVTNHFYLTRDAGWVAVQSDVNAPANSIPLISAEMTGTNGAAQNIRRHANRVDLLPFRAISLQRLDFFQDNIAGTQGAAALSNGRSTRGYVVASPEEVKRLFVRSNAPITAGTLTITVLINGVAVTGGTAILNAANPTYRETEFTFNQVPLVQGDVITVQSVSAGITPAGSADLDVTVEIGQ